MSTIEATMIAEALNNVAAALYSIHDAIETAGDKHASALRSLGNAMPPHVIGANHATRINVTDSKT